MVVGTGATEGVTVTVMVLVLVSVGTWAAVNLPVALLAPENWSEFYRFSSERGGTAAAVWDLAAHYQVFITDIPMRNLLSGLAFVAGMVAMLRRPKATRFCAGRRPWIWSSVRRLITACHKPLSA